MPDADARPSQSTAGPGVRSPGRMAQRLRQLHAAMAPLVLLPLLLTVASGVGYRLLRDWGGFDRQSVHLLLVLHEGEWLQRWLGPPGETLYVLLNGLGLIWMLVTGGGMLLQRWKQQWKQKWLQRWWRRGEGAAP